jgi:DNA-binding MarR family transcriptional regulator
VAERQLPGPSSGEAAAPHGGAGRARTRKRRRALDLGVLDGHLGYFVRRLQVWIFQDFVRTLSAFDIRPAQFSVLVVIEANPGLSQADLADTLGIERARLVRLLDGLEKHGLTRRQPSPNDRRSHALSLTEVGRTALERIKSQAAEHETHLANRLGADKRDVLLKALRDFA